MHTVAINGTAFDMVCTITVTAQKPQGYGGAVLAQRIEYMIAGGNPSSAKLTPPYSGWCGIVGVWC